MFDTKNLDSPFFSPNSPIGNYPLELSINLEQQISSGQVSFCETAILLDKASLIPRFYVTLSSKANDPKYNKYITFNPSPTSQRDS
eukprot:g19384.t1